MSCIWQLASSEVKVALTRAPSSLRRKASSCEYVELRIAGTTGLSAAAMPVPSRTSIATTLIAGCQLDGNEPWANLRDVLTLLPTWPRNAVLDLAPKFWI
jgi:hypothetical protein